MIMIDLFVYFSILLTDIKETICRNEIFCSQKDRSRNNDSTMF